MAVWRFFLKFEAFIVCSGLPHLTQQVQIQKQMRQTAINICSGLFFPRAKKPSEDITRRLFLNNMKGLRKKILKMY
jgi:hypothetical protein